MWNMVRCEFCGREVEEGKLGAHRGSCKRYREFKKFMEGLERIVKEKWLKGEITDVSQINIAKEKEIENLIADINKQLGEIRGLLRKILEKLE